MHHLEALLRVQEWRTGCFSTSQHMSFVFSGAKVNQLDMMFTARSGGAKQSFGGPAFPSRAWERELD